MTIPGFTPLEIVPQSHIHLGLVPYDGSDPSGFGTYNEPPYQFDHVTKRIPVYEIMSEFVRAQDGTPSPHSLKQSNYSLVFEGFRYYIRVDDEGLQILKRLYRNPVYLVDSRHCADGQDHAPYTKIMYFDDLSYDDHLDQLLNLNDLILTFRDMTTVAPL